MTMTYDLETKKVYLFLLHSLVNSCRLLESLSMSGSCELCCKGRLSTLSQVFYTHYGFNATEGSTIVIFLVNKNMNTVGEGDNSSKGILIIWGNLEFEPIITIHKSILYLLHLQVRNGKQLNTFFKKPYH